MQARIAAAIRRFNELNAQDPRTISVDGADRPLELVQAERLERWIVRLAPNASVPLRLAARCQHLERWAIPRSDYPPGRVGYLKWRKALSHRHADRATEVLQELGFSADTIEAVRTIVLKQGLKTNADTQVMEDALCLAFLEHDFAEFSTRYDDAKVIDILQKTWRKMSETGRAQALALDLPPQAARLVGRALADTDDTRGEGAADASSDDEPA